MRVFKFVVRARSAGRLLTMLCSVLMTLMAQPLHAQAQHAAMAVMVKKLELASGAAVDASGNFWSVSKQTTTGESYVVLQSSSDGGHSWSVPRRVQSEPEAISADGENRPKIVFGPQGQMYITYTKPLTKPYTGDIRFIRSLDGGKTFSAPLTVHANRDLITHRFESIQLDRQGRIFIAWIDKRDQAAAAARKEKYAGAAIYYAVSDDAGKSFRGDYKLAEHTCECCRIALALTPDDRVVALWRHVFEPNARDHAIAVLAVDGKPAALERATFDDWRIDACPHHGPGLAYADDGTRHQVWFNVKGGEGGVFYASVSSSGVMSSVQQLGTAQAAHADVLVYGKHVVLAWRQFDGKSTAILARHSADGGVTWRELELARTEQASDQPHLFKTRDGIALAWRTQQEGMRIVPVASVVPSLSVVTAVPALQAFEMDSFDKLVAQQKAAPFVLVLWSLDCEYCTASLKTLAQVQQTRKGLRIVTLATDTLTDAELVPLMRQRLASFGLSANAWAYGNAPAEQLRYAIDPKWYGEMPRSYWFNSRGERRAYSGVITPAIIDKLTAGG